MGNVYFTYNGFLLPLVNSRLKGKIYPLISLRGTFTSLSVRTLNRGSCNVDELLASYTFKFGKPNDSLYRHIVEKNPHDIQATLSPVLMENLLRLRFFEPREESKHEKLLILDSEDDAEDEDG